MNPLDCKLREGQLRIIWRLKPPFVLGVDVAGVRMQSGHARGRIVVRP